ncbi:MAG: hypothetical protein AAFY17_06925 [Cyanobacteria bacterium J06642_11]
MRQVSAGLACSCPRDNCNIQSFGLWLKGADRFAIARQFEKQIHNLPTSYL